MHGVHPKSFGLHGPGVGGPVQLLGLFSAQYGLGTGVGWLGARLGNDVSQYLGVVDDRAGPQHVLVEWLPLLIGAKERGLKDLLERLALDVVRRIMDECARLYCPVSRDMEVPAPAGNAPPAYGAVVPEVDYHNRLGLTYGTNPLNELR